jgi:hypothetical protein
MQILLNSDGRQALVSRQSDRLGHLFPPFMSPLNPGQPETINHGADEEDQHCR